MSGRTAGAPEVARARQSHDHADKLTARERQVLELVALGLTSKAIAGELGISERTVKNHLQGTFVRLGVSCRIEALRAVGLIQPRRRKYQATRRKQ